VKKVRRRRGEKRTENRMGAATSTRFQLHLLLAEGLRKKKRKKKGGEKKHRREDGRRKGRGGERKQRSETV